MKANLVNVGVRFHTRIVQAYQIVGGAAGWIDTNASAALGVYPSRLYQIGVYSAAVQAVGARAHGDGNDVSFTSGGGGGVILAYTDSAGHFDLYRSAADNWYYVIGYLE